MSSLRLALKRSLAESTQIPSPQDTVQQPKEKAKRQQQQHSKKIICHDVLYTNQCYSSIRLALKRSLAESSNIKLQQDREQQSKENSHVISLTEQHYSYICFLVKNICNENWFKLIDTICDIDIQNTPMDYIMLGQNRGSSEVIGYVQYNGSKNFQLDQLENILQVRNVLVWREANMFKHLSIFPTFLRSIATLEAKCYFEDGISKDENEINIQTSSKSSCIDNTVIHSLFEHDKTTSPMVLIIEQRKTELARGFKESCNIRKKNLMLSLLDRDELANVHIIYPNAIQCYHSFDFHQNPHYGVRIEIVPILKWMLDKSNITYTEYSGDVSFHHNNFLTVYNNYALTTFPAQQLYSIMNTYKLKSRNVSNIFLSYGYSAEYRSITGEPKLTVNIENNSGNKKKLLPIILPILSHLSKNLKQNYGDIAQDQDRNEKYAGQLGSNFNHSLQGTNYFEGFDIAIMYSDCYISPHCDVMNDWRNGYNFITVLKSTFLDDDIKKLVTVSLICYTRKAVGDHLTYLDKKRK